MSTPPMTPAPDDWLHAVLHQLDHLLPAQAPIRDFVHHNTLHGFQHLPFRQAIAAAEQAHGQRGYLPEAEFRRLHRAGRIADADLAAAMESAAAEAPAEFPFARQPLPAGIDRAAFWRAMWCAPTEPLTRAALRWQMEEVRQPAAEDADWLACSAAARQRAGEDLSHGDSLRSQKISAHATLVADDAGAALFDCVGLSRTWREALEVLTGLDLAAEITPPEVRFFAAGLDRGVAAWPLPERASGLYTAWRQGLRGDPTQGGASNDLGRSALYDELPADPAAAITLLLDHYALPAERRAGYLIRLALGLPGWTGMLNWHQQHGEVGEGRNPLRLLDGLAILLASEYHVVSRLIFERWSLRPRLDMLAWYFREHPAEALIRCRLHATPLPEALAARAARLIASVPNPAEGDGPEWQALAAEIRRADRDNAQRDSDAALAYPLWQVCRQAGIAAARLDGEAVTQLLAALCRFDTGQRSYVWLLAYERAYRQRVLAVLVANRTDAPTPAGRPSAQVLCCMDEREEGFRRHLEEIAPTVETLGAAGFFGVAMRWRGLDAEDEVPLCPVVVTPTHRVAEVAADPVAGAAREARRQRRLALRRGIFQRSRHRLATALAATVAGAPLALAALGGRLLAPRLTGELERRLAAGFDGEVKRELRYTAVATSPDDPASGFTDDEQADRVFAILRTIGLTAGFAPLVAIVGHGSHSLNNPHASAYDCGACGGKHGGPNARLLAAMANRQQVRQRLQQRGLAIPDDCWFIAAQHDTCDDSTTWYDSAQIPDTHREDFFALRRQLDEAGRRHAQERCRRFASAPDGLGVDAAWRHVAQRGDMPAQSRPELGHVTNACAIIGRRTLSRGSFLDRRCFLISYDPRVDATPDEDGRILEGILLAAGPVGAGISLEYYFSTVNNAGWGCRSKVMHNLAGLVGVMEGTQSDLRTGLPQQMIEIHEAMRLLVICDAEPATLSAIVARQPALQELVGLGWITVVACAPSTGQLSLLEPARGWLPWQADPNEQTDAAAVPRAAQSVDCYLDAAGRFRREALPPGLLRPREAQ